MAEDNEDEEGNEITADSVSSKVSFFETSLQETKGKMASTPPRNKNKSTKTSSASAAVEDDDDDDDIVKKYAIVHGAELRSTTPLTDDNDKKEKEEQENNTNTNTNNVDDDAIHEADDIIDVFPSSDSDDNNEDAEAAAAESDDKALGFSDKSNSSEEKSEEESDDGNDGDNDEDENETPRDIALGFGVAAGAAAIVSGDDDDDNMSDLNDDITLEQLFSTATNLDVTLETKWSSAPRQELYEQIIAGDEVEVGDGNSFFDGIEAPANSVIEEEQEKGDDQNRATPAVVAAAAIAGAAVASSSSSRSRTLLYDSDDDDDDDDVDIVDDDEVEEGRTSAFVPMASTTTTHGLMSLPYSTGKWKKNEDGMSVTSDDISTGLEGGPSILKGGEMLPYTVLNSNPKTAPPKDSTERKYVCYIILFLLLLVAMIGAIIAIFLSPVDPTGGGNGGGTGGGTGGGNNNGVSNLPIISPPPSPTTITLPPISPTTIDGAGGTIIPVTFEPSMAPTQKATPETTEGLVTNFKYTATFVGQGNGDRFGSVVSMSADGTFMAVLSNSPTDPVLSFQRRDFSSDSSDWFPILPLPSEGMTSSSSSLAFGGDIATATTPEDGFPVVAISSRTQVEVYELKDGSGAWTERGQPLQWDSTDSTTVSYTTMALSSDASTLAAGYVNDAGDTISVNVYRYDTAAQTWVPFGDDPLLFNARTRTVGAREGTILSISLALSGDGKVLTVEEWAVASPQVVIQNFGWKDDRGDGGDTANWYLMGSSLPVPFGPASIALSNNGRRVAVVANHPGKGAVFDWDGNEWNMIGGDEDHGFLPGGSSVTLARNGSRILIGDASMNKALVYDYVVEDYNSAEWSSAWLSTTSLWGPDSSGFGTSVVMDETGNTVGIGAPTSNLSGNNLGQVIIYG